MPNTEIIRAYQLKRGDRFIMLGMTYEVIRNDGHRIYYTIKDAFGGWSYKQSMGARSSEILLLITETNSLNIKNYKNGNYVEC